MNPDDAPYKEAQCPRCSSGNSARVEEHLPFRVCNACGMSWGEFAAVKLLLRGPKRLTAGEAITIAVTVMMLLIGWVVALSALLYR